MDSYDIFISYSSRDALPHRVCSELEARGLRCWIAPRDIRPGKLLTIEEKTKSHI